MKASQLMAVGTSPNVFVTDRNILCCRFRTVAANRDRIMLTASHVRTLRGHGWLIGSILLDLRDIDKTSPLIQALMMSEKLPALTDELRPAPKKRGRKPGGGKVPGSGRKPGGKNKIPTDMRSVILQRGKPLELLCDISRGVKIRVGPQAGPSEPQYTYPTLQERAAAAKILIDKLMPAASASSGDDKDGAPIAQEMSSLEVVKRIAFVLRSGTAERDRELQHQKTAETQSVPPAPPPPPEPEITPSESPVANSRWVDPSRLLHPSQCDDPPQPKVIRFRPKGI